jgi:hypothetical protein
VHFQIAVLHGIDFERMGNHAYVGRHARSTVKERQRERYIYIKTNKYRCIYIYEERIYRKKMRTRYRYKEIDMHIQAQELHNGEVHMLKAVACCVW